MAARTVSNTGGNWNDTAAWVGGVVPIAGDTVDFTSTSGNLTVNVSTASLAGINFTNYVNTITFNNNINVNTSVNLGTGGYTQAGASGLVINGTTTITSNGVIWSRTLSFSTGTQTLSDNLTVTGTVTFSSTVTMNSNTFNIGGDLTISSGAGGIISGTTNFVFNGSGTWTHSSSAQLRNNVTINTAGTLTLGTIYYNTGTLTYTSGTIVNTGNTMIFSGGVVTTLNTSGMSFNNVTITTANSSLSLTSDLNIDGTLTISSTSSINGVYNVNVKGNLTINGALSGTSTITINGTGSQTWSHGGAVNLTNNLTINKVSGTLTVSGNVYYVTGTLTYIAGNVTTTGSTLNISSSCTLATNGITWNNIATTGTGTTTITLSSNLTWSGTLSLVDNTLGVNGATRTVTFSGSNLTPVSTANVSIGTSNFGNNSQTTVVNFPASTTLSITNLTVGCGGTTNVGYNATINNATFNISGNFTTNYSNQGISRVNGTSSQINMVGTGTIVQTGSISVAYLSIPININTSGTITISGNYYFESVVVTYTAGTISGLGISVFITCTLNLNAGGQWGTTVQLVGATTLTSNATFGNLNTSTTAVALSGDFTINVTGNLTISIATSGASTPIILNGTGAQTWSHSSAVYLSNNLTINKASGTLTVSGNVYYVTGTLTYTTGTVTTTGSTIVFNGTTTISTNGITWNNAQLGGASPTYTLSNNFTVGGTLTLNASGTETVNGSVLYLASLSHTGALCQGTTTFTFYTTGTWSTAGGNALRNPTIIDTSSNTLTIASQIRYDTGTLTYTSGTVDTTTNSSTIVFSNNTTLSTNGVTWYNVTINVASVLTLTNNFVWSNNFSISTAVAVSFAGVGNLSPTATANLVLSTTSTFTPKNNIQINNATVFGTINTNTISISGNLIVNGATSGTTNLTLNGSGAQSWTHGSAVYLSNNLTISKSGGTLTVGANVYYNTRTLTYNAGTVDTTTNNSTLNCNASTTFVTNGMSWRNVTLSGTSQTFTFTNDFTLTGTLTLSGTASMVLNSSSIYTSSILVNTTATVSGTSTINFTGTGTWSHSVAGYLLNNVNINTSGTLTLGANIYYSISTITYISGTVDSTTNSNTLNILVSNTNTWYTVLLNTAGMSWFNVSLVSVGGDINPITVTISSDFNVLRTLTIYNAQSITGFAGNGLLTCDTLVIQGANGNNSRCNFNGNSIYTRNLQTIAVGAGTQTIFNNANLYVSGNITIGNSNLIAPLVGTAILYYVGSGTWSTTSVVNQILTLNFVLNTGGTLTLSGNIYYHTGTFTHLRGTISARNSTFNIIAAATFIGCNKSNFDRVVITSGINVTMNEFFCGSPSLKTTVSPSSTTNYGIIFNDSLEKLAFYVKVSRATISRTNQLTIVTDRGNNLNNVGIKFAPNQLPNGLPKNNPLVSNQSQLGSFLLSEPIYN